MCCVQIFDRIVRWFQLFAKLCISAAANEHGECGVDERYDSPMNIDVKFEAFVGTRAAPTPAIASRACSYSAWCSRHSLGLNFQRMVVFWRPLPSCLHGFTSTSPLLMVLIVNKNSGKLVGNKVQRATIRLPGRVRIVIILYGLAEYLAICFTWLLKEPIYVVILTQEWLNT